jgi:hypothetical protein
MHLQSFNRDSLDLGMYISFLCSVILSKQALSPLTRLFLPKHKQIEGVFLEIISSYRLRSYPPHSKVRNSYSISPQHRTIISSKLPLTSVDDMVVMVTVDLCNMPHTHFHCGYFVLCVQVHHSLLPHVGSAPLCLQHFLLA